MTITEAIPTFGTSHDPDDIEARNIGIGGRLRRISGTYSSATVVVVDGPDSSLTISAVAFDEATQRVSFRIAGGTAGGWYLIRLRVFLADGRQFDQSVWQDVRDH